MQFKMPSHVSARSRKGRKAFYFIVRRDRPEGWPATIPLGSDPVAAASNAQRLNDELGVARAGLPIKPGHGTLPWLIRTYETSRKWTALKPRTQRSYRYCAKEVERWAFVTATKQGRHLHVREIKTSSVLRFVSLFDATPTKRRQIAAYLGIILDHARHLGVIDANPARRLGLKEKRPETALWTREDVDAVCAAARPSVALAVKIGYWAGQRIGDVLRLQKPRDYRDGVFRFSQEKTGQAVAVPAAAELRATLDSLPREQLVLVVNEMTGKAYNARVFSRAFRDACDKAGREHLVFHGLRHTWVTDALASGITAKLAMTGSGHVSERTVNEVYGRKLVTVAKTPIERLEAYRSSTGVERPGQTPVERLDKNGGKTDA